MLSSIGPALAIGCSLVGFACAAVAASAKAPVVAADTVVCTRPENIEVANLPAVAKSDVVLRALGCRRSDGTGLRKLPQNART
jgi:hypothetical protein